MLNLFHISVIIPALNEAESLLRLLPKIPKYIDHVLVVDNGSTDATASIAHEQGAHVVSEPRRGYGQACLTGISNLPKTDILIFIDADCSNDPSTMDQLCQPIIDFDYDFVLASRMHAKAAKHLTIPQKFGNQLACLLMKWIWSSHYTDLGPFRAISRSALEKLSMQDRNYGWTVEMQVKASQQVLRTREINLPYRQREYGCSKVSGTIKGVCLAGSKILYIIARSFISEKLLHQRSNCKASNPRSGPESKTSRHNPL